MVGHLRHFSKGAWDGRAGCCADGVAEAGWWQRDDNVLHLLLITLTVLDYPWHEQLQHAREATGTHYH